MANIDIAIIIAIVGVLIPGCALAFTIRSFRRQLQLNFFSEYTRRYQEIMLNFPGGINREDFELESLDVQSKDKVLRYMRAYFDLCSEEFFLKKNGHIGDRTWEEWKAGMEFSFSKTAFKSSWKLLLEDTIYYGEFCRFVENGMSD